MVSPEPSGRVLGAEPRIGHRHGDEVEQEIGRATASPLTRSAAPRWIRYDNVLEVCMRILIAGLIAFLYLPLVPL